MNYSDYNKKLLTVKEYIEKKRANTPKMLSQKLALSERTVLRMIVQLKEQGCNIKYCRKEKVYKILL